MSALIGLAIAALLWWGLKTFGRSRPGDVARLLKAAGGIAALGGAAVLMIRGRLDMAALAGGAGAWLLGWSAPPGWLPSNWIRGRRGPAGNLDALSEAEAELLALRAECLARDVESARLVEADLDRRFPGWREHAHRDADGRGRPELQRGTMPEKEAYEVLGLQPGADADAIVAAHRSLMKRLHPDGGGSTYLASRVNQAKDVLLNRHR